MQIWVLKVLKAKEQTSFENTTPMNFIEPSSYVYFFMLLILDTNT